MKKLLLITLLPLSVYATDKNKTQDINQDQHQEQSQYQIMNNDWFYRESRAPKSVECSPTPGSISINGKSVSVPSFSVCGSYDNYTHSQTGTVGLTIPIIPKRYKSALDAELTKDYNEDEKYEELWRKFDQHSKQQNKQIQQLMEENKRLSEELNKGK